MKKLLLCLLLCVLFSFNLSAANEAVWRTVSLDMTLSEVKSNVAFSITKVDLSTNLFTRYMSASGITVGEYNDVYVTFDFYNNRLFRLRFLRGGYGMYASSCLESLLTIKQSFDERYSLDSADISTPYPYTLNDWATSYILLYNLGGYMKMIYSLPEITTSDGESHSVKLSLFTGKNKDVYVTEWFYAIEDITLSIEEQLSEDLSSDY